MRIDRIKSRVVLVALAVDSYYFAAYQYREFLCNYCELGLDYLSFVHFFIINIIINY